MRQERPIVFSCNDDRLVGILHAGRANPSTGIVIVVGGPQYRAGSHRQFVLMARQFSAAGIPVLRFDYRGMGDAEGATRSFDQVDDDIRAAIDAFTDTQPGVKNVVLLGLCDAASASLIYARADERVVGLVLMNPWVRTARGEANTYLRHYYLQRLFQRSFWKKILSGEFAIGRSVREFMQTRRTARGVVTTGEMAESTLDSSFVDRMLSGLAGFRHPVLFLISERDLTAQEFVDLCRENSRFRHEVAKKGCEFHTVADADHTLSRRRDLESATQRAIAWLADTAIVPSRSHFR